MNVDIYGKKYGDPNWQDEWQIIDARYSSVAITNTTTQIVFDNLLPMKEYMFKYYVTSPSNGIGSAIEILGNKDIYYFALGYIP